MSDDLTNTTRTEAPAAPVVSPGPAVAAPPARRRGNSGLWLNLLLGLAAAVAIGGVAFAVGRSTAPAPVAAAGGFGRGNFGNGGPGASFAPGQGAGLGLGGRGGLSISGTVESVAADAITIKTANGQTVTVSLSGDTTYHQATAATAADVTTGASVSVRVGGFGGGQGGGQANGGNANGATPDLTATDVTVDR